MEKGCMRYIKNLEYTHNSILMWLFS